MRIAMIGSRGIPARAGGVERVVEELTRELTARGHEVLVYGRRGYLAGAVEAPVGRVILTPGLDGKHLETITHTACAMFDVLRRGVDVVHIHSPGPALLGWLPAAAGKPIVLTIHAADWRREKWSAPARAMLHAGLVCGMKVADAVTAVSRELADDLSQRFGRDVHCVSNAVRPAGQTAEAPTALGLRPDGYALYVGRIVPEKRLDLLVRAWAQLDGQMPLVVAGDADESRYGRQCVRQAGGNVRFVGAICGEELSQLYAHASLVIHPSVLEGMSLVLLEAAAHGRCVLAADIPANREALDDAAAYFRRDDLAELAGWIRRLLSQRELRRDFGRKALQRAKTQFSWPERVDRYERIYDSVRVRKNVDGNCRRNR